MRVGRVFDQVARRFTQCFLIVLVVSVGLIVRGSMGGMEPSTLFIVRIGKGGSKTRFIIKFMSVSMKWCITTKPGLYAFFPWPYGMGDVKMLPYD